MMKKRIVSIVLVLAMLGLFLPSGAGSMNVFADGKFKIEDGVLTKYTGAGGDVVIPNSVTSIGEFAFSGCSSLTSVTIPNSVTSIGEKAFYYCSSLTSVTIPNSVTSIGGWAFYGCSSLTSVTIPNSVTSIGNSAFRNCSSLTSVTIPNSVTSIGDWAFSDCSSMTSVTIPNSVTSIWEGAFSGCSSLTSVTIPNSVTSIGGSAFSNCDELTRINVGSGNANYVSQDGVLYNKSKTELLCYPNKKGNTFTIPNSVTSIGDEAFSGCSSLTSVTIPNSVTSIGGYAFRDCSSLTSVTIPNSVTSIGGHAFYGCSGLTSVTIPNSVTSIENWAFSDCSSLTSVTIPNSVTSIGWSAFIGCRSLTSVTIPNSVTSIGDEAFSGCSSLTSVTIPNSVTSIGCYAFEDCSSLTSVTIPNSVTSIEPWAFSDCSSLTSVTIPNSVTSIGKWAFEDCSSLTSVTIPNSVTSIGWNAFEDCDNLKDIYYAGTQQQWNSLLINEYGNKVDLGLNGSVTVHFNFVPTQLSITSHPADVTAKAGDSVSFSVKAEGEGLTYQWYYKKAGQTAWNKWGTRTTATTTATANDTWNGMQVYCKVTDKDGKTSDSNPATITIQRELKITTQPTNKTVKLGDSLTLSLKAEGNGLTYQWYFKKAGQTSFSKWNGRTKASETCTPNATWDGIQLYCIVKDSSGKSVQSNTVIISVTQDLKITTQPTNKTVKLGDSVTLSLKAEGIGLSYQWYFKKSGQTSFSKWNGRTHASETVTPNATWDGIQLYCVAKDSSGKSVQSNTVKISVTQDLKITTQPTDKTINLGDSVTLSLKAQGIGLSYQWYFKKAGQTSFSKWNGRTHASETVTPNATWNGIQLYCVVKDSLGKSVQSNTVKITVTQDLKITTQPTDKTINLGDSVTLSLKAQGIGLSYQWYFKKAGQTSFSKWNGRTHASETVTPNATWNGIQLYCVVTDSAGNSVKSGTAKITIK